MTISTSNERNNFLRKRLFLLEEDNPGLYKNAYEQLSQFEIELIRYKQIISLDEKASVKKPLLLSG